MGSKQVITLQFGGFANFVGAHYWNFQDEVLGILGRDGLECAASQIDADVLYALGEDERGHESYTPRLLLCDLSGSLGGVSTGGSHLSHGPPQVVTWDGPVAVHVTERVARSRFVRELEEEQEEDEDREEGTNVTHTANGSAPHAHDQDAAEERLQSAAREVREEGAARFWTDYMKAVLQPRNVLQLPGLWQGVAPFSGFGEGRAVLADLDFRDTLLDRIRSLAEACDQLQGFQVFSEDLSGFGQITSAILAEVEDDYPRAPVLLFSVRQDASADRQTEEVWETRVQALNKAMSLALLPKLASLYVPVAVPSGHLPFLRGGPRTPFMQAALLASVIDSVTLPYRLSHAPRRCVAGVPIGAADLHSLVQLLVSRPGVNVGAVSAAVPCPSLPGVQSLAADTDGRLRHDAASPSAAASPLACPSWTPGIAAGRAGTVAESVVVRGPRRGGNALEATAALQALDAALLLEGTRCVRHRCVVPQPLPIPLPFPPVFAPSLLRYGDVASSTASLAASASAGTSGAANGGPHMAGGDVASVPVLARLAATSAVGELAVQQQTQLRRVGNSQGGKAVLGSWGYDAADVDEMAENLHALAGAYHDGSDDDFD